MKDKDTTLQANPGYHNGFIKLHRNILLWEWWSDKNTTRVFIYLLLKANYKPKQWQGITIPAGSFVTSLQTVSGETGISIRSARTSLDKLEKTGELTRRPTNKYTLISLRNWDKYQSCEDPTDKQTDKQPTNNRQATDKQLTTTEERKESKERKEGTIRERDKIPPAIDDVISYFDSKDVLNSKVEAKKFYDYYNTTDWMRGGAKIRNWESAANLWIDKGMFFNDTRNNNNPRSGKPTYTEQVMRSLGIGAEVHMPKMNLKRKPPQHTDTQGGENP